MFYVWRRNDGYVAVTLQMPQDYLTGGAEPEPGSRERVGSGKPVTFVKLDEFPTFDAAYKLATKMREGTVWQTLE